MITTSVRLLLVSCILSCSIGLAQAQKAQIPLAPEDALAVRSFAYRTAIDLSPDGEWIAYTLESQAERELITDERYYAYSRTGVSSAGASKSVWVTNIKSGESKRLIERGSSSWGVSWSPDGRY